MASLPFLAIASHSLAESPSGEVKAEDLCSKSVLVFQVAEVSNAALEAATTVQAAQETSWGPAGATGGERSPTAPESFITDKLEALLTPALKVSSQTPPLQQRTGL